MSWVYCNIFVHKLCEKATVPGGSNGRPHYTNRTKKPRPNNPPGIPVRISRILPTFPTILRTRGSRSLRLPTSVEASDTGLQVSCLAETPYNSHSFRASVFAKKGFRLNLVTYCDRARQFQQASLTVTDRSLCIRISFPKTTLRSARAISVDTGHAASSRHANSGVGTRPSGGNGSLSSYLPKQRCISYPQLHPHGRPMKLDRGTLQIRRRCLQDVSRGNLGQKGSRQAS